MNFKFCTLLHIVLHTYGEYFITISSFSCIWTHESKTTPTSSDRLLCLQRYQSKSYEIPLSYRWHTQKNTNMFLFIFCSLTPHLNSSSPLGSHTLGGDYLKHLRNVLKSRASSISHTHAHSRPATGFHPPLLTVLHVPFEYPLLSHCISASSSGSGRIWISSLNTSLLYGTTYGIQWCISAFSFVWQM